MSAQLAPLEPEPQRPLTTAPGTPARLIEYAMQQGADMDRLEKLLELQERWEANEARKAYHLALSDFKAEPLSITKDRRVFFKGKDGKPDTEFFHATLGNVVAVIAPVLGRHRLSHSWGVHREGERIFVTCRLTHALGHSETITLDGPLDTSGSKNNIQSVGSTITYLERYTLLAITGLATEDQDDDGKQGEGQPPQPATITEEQQAKLKDALEATGRDEVKFKAWLKVERFDQLPAHQFETALREASKPRKAAP